MQDEQFEWDDEKARRNLLTHKISFDVAKRIFDDPLLLDEVDDSMAYDEERYRAIGSIEGRFIIVSYAMRSHRIRIISARKATPSERRKYDDRI